MKPVIRSLTRWLYAHVAKPLLFRRKPDAVHHNLVTLTMLVQRVPGIRQLPRLWSHREDAYLAQTIHGITFHNPIGLSAGFDKQINMPRMMRSVGFGWMTGGSVTWGEYCGNDGAWFYRLPKSKSLVVNAGLPSEGTEVVAERVAAHDPRLFADFPLSVSVAKTNSRHTVDEQQAIEDYCASLARFDTIEQVRMHEINISCPNTFGGEPFTTAARLDRLLKATDALQLKKPVFIKMPSGLDIDGFDALLDTIAQHHVNGLTIGNLLKDRTAVKLDDVLPDEVRGNLSGAPTRAVTTELIRRAYRRHGDRLTIIGVGGVFSAEDAYEKIRAGAHLVALITGMIYEGPQLVGEINYGLVKLLRRDGFASVTDAVGVDAR